jgi:hypothetical protein
VNATEKDNPTSMISLKWKIILGIFVLLLFCLGVISQSVDSIAHQWMNRTLDQYLVSGGHLDGVNISVLTGRIELNGLTINAPKEHGDEPLLSLRSLVLNIDLKSLLGDTLIIDALHLKNLTANMVRDSQGHFGLKDLIKQANTVDRNQVDQPAAAADKQGIPALQIHEISLTDGRIKVQDNALTEEPLLFVFNNLKLHGNDLRLFSPDTAPEPPATFKLSFEMEQPGTLPPALFGSVSRVGPITAGLPAINAQSRLIGLKLDTLGPLIPPATRTALGADGIDSGAMLALNRGQIFFHGQVVTDRNIRYNTIDVHGPLAAPEVNIAPVWSSVFRVTGGVLNIGKKGFGAGIKIAGGGIDVVQETGSGVLKIGKDLLSNILTTGAGLVTLDGEKIKQGITGTVKDTFEDSRDTAEDVGDAAVGGIKESTSTLTGAAKIQRWEENIATRYRTAMEHAEKTLHEMPYPPVIEE